MNGSIYDLTTLPPDPREVVLAWLERHRDTPAGAVLAREQVQECQNAIDRAREAIAKMPGAKKES